MSVLGQHYKPDPTPITNNTLNDLKEYFRRPAVISTGNLTLDVVTNHIQNVLSINTMASWFPFFRERLTGVAGINFHAVFTLQVNTTPFSQGVLAMAFQYGETGTNQLNRAPIPALCTNLPHVRCDISETTMVQLKVPFVHSSQFLDIQDGSNLGIFAFNSILPVRAGAVGNTAPSYRLMVHLEDLNLFYAAPATTANVVFQSGGKAPIDSEFENDAYPFSSGLHSMSKTVRWIAKGVPSLSSLAGPTTWFLGRAAGVVRYLGYSKPTIQDPMKKVISYNTAQEHNVDVPSSAIMVGPMASNRMVIDSNISCTDVDEMAFDYILTQWGQMARFSIDTTVAQGTNVWGTLISPSCYWFKSNPSGSSYNRNIPVTGTPATSNAFIPTHLFYWSQLFKLWRGDFEFRFTFSKTKMHAGRVMVAFAPSGGNTIHPCGPNDTPTTAPTSSSLTPFPFSAVFDLKDDNVFTFKVPYYNNLGYTDVNEYTGTLVMKMFDTLKTSAMTSPNIQCLVEVRALPGFELAYPHTPNYIVADNDTLPIYQSGVVAVINRNIYEQCIGEHITSVKQLIAMPCEVESNLNAFLAYGIGPNQAQYKTVMPWYVPAPFPVPAVPNNYDYTPASAGSFSFCKYARNAYLFARGSTDVHINAISTVPLSYYAIQTPLNTSASLINRVVSNVGTVFSGFTGNFRFPGYQRPVRSPMAYMDDYQPVYAASLPTQLYPTSPTYGCGIRVMNPGNLGAWYQMRVCAGDDSMLGMYIGPQYLVFPSTLAKAGDNWTAQFLQNGTVVPPTLLAAAALPAAALADVPVASAATAAVMSTELTLTDVTQTIDTFTKVSPFSVTPPPPMTSGDGGVQPSGNSGSLTRPLPRAFKMNVDEVKSVLDAVNSVLQ